MKPTGAVVLDERALEVLRPPVRTAPRRVLHAADDLADGALDVGGLRRNELVDSVKLKLEALSVEQFRALPDTERDKLYERHAAASVERAMRNV